MDLLKSGEMLLNPGRAFRELQNEIAPVTKIRLVVDTNKHLSRIEIEVMIWLRNVLKTCIINVTNSNFSFVFFQGTVKMFWRFSNIF